jgi:hypothetical protein
MYRNCVAVVTSEEHIVEMSVLLSILNYYLLHYWLFLRVHLSVKVSVLQIKMVSMWLYEKSGVNKWNVAFRIKFCTLPLFYD